eukprot:TRINITY_DN11798_c0_g1_i3.p2 TRINITY_DN11798_c0_g1~~TRINITY_DN11798_c0_g1_i3.p2  ORF type:complete len:119 (-),score=14.70 TRINITY_DN11798_c0_g1_i3:385-741(-)
MLCSGVCKLSTTRDMRLTLLRMPILPISEHSVAAACHESQGAEPQRGCADSRTRGGRQASAPSTEEGTTPSPSKRSRHVSEVSEDLEAAGGDNVGKPPNVNSVTTTSHQEGADSRGAA